MIIYFLIGTGLYLNGEHEGDPLVVRSIWGVISTLHPVKVDNALDVSLK